MIAIAYYMYCLSLCLNKKSCGPGPQDHDHWWTAHREKSQAWRVVQSQSTMSMTITAYIERKKKNAGGKAPIDQLSSAEKCAVVYGEVVPVRRKKHRNTRAGENGASMQLTPPGRGRYAWHAMEKNTY